MLIDQNRGAVAGEGVDDERCADRDVMIAQDGVALRAGKGAEDLSAAMGRVSGGDEGQRAACDEIACEKNDIGGEGVDFVDDVLEKERLGEFVEVDVAKLDDAIAVELVGKIPDADGLMDCVEVMARDLAGVKREACSGDARADEKFAASETGRLVGGNTGHRS